MAKIRLTKEFDFEAAHALWNYDGKCKNIHGHSYKLFVTVVGKPSVNELSPKCGMVMDFGDLKGIVKSEIIDIYDHALVLNQKSPHAEITKQPQMFDRHIIVPYQPTAENMLLEFVQKIQKRLPEGVKLINLKLYETSRSYAEWCAEDNL